jgi:hypothetical protein
VNTLPNTPSADIDRNFRINSIDAALILQYVAGLLNQLPA